MKEPAVSPRLLSSHSSTVKVISASQLSSHHHHIPHRRTNKHVHFSDSTTNILSSLCQRTTPLQVFRYSDPIPFFSDSNRHCRPALKYSIEMVRFFREAGSQLAKALALFGEWCTGVTSTNPNVRSDMYKQLTAQIRSTSPHLKAAGEAVLVQSIQGMWYQLVDDFTTLREEYTEREIVLYVPCCGVEANTV